MIFGSRANHGLAAVRVGKCSPIYGLVGFSIGGITFIVMMILSWPLFEDRRLQFMMCFMVTIVTVIVLIDECHDRIMENKSARAEEAASAQNVHDSLRHDYHIEDNDIMIVDGNYYVNKEFGDQLT